MVPPAREWGSSNMHRRKAVQTIGIAGLSAIGVSTVSGQPDNRDNGGSPFRNYGQAKSQSTQAPITGWRYDGEVHPIPVHEPMYFMGDAFIWHEPSAGYNMEEVSSGAITPIYHDEHKPGLITLFYRVNDEWYYIDVRFNGNGELVHANGVELPAE